MGNFQTINLKGVKRYNVFQKKSFKKVLELYAYMPSYEFAGDRVGYKTETFYDTKNNLLESAGIILCKVVDEGKAYLKIDREENLIENKTKDQRKLYIHQIGVNDSIEDNMYYIIDGITSLFSTNFSIDLENVIKNVEPKIKIKTKSTILKVLNGTGFKAEINMEEVKIKNLFKRKKAKTNLLIIEESSSKNNMKDFEEFIVELEKRCKEITPTKETNYEMAKRMTR